MNFFNKDKKGSTVSNIIMWIGIVLALLIIIFGVTKRISPEHYTYEKINYDLKKINNKIEESYTAYEYFAKYNPKNEKGTLIITEDKICINNSLYYCKEIVSDLDEQNISLENITYIIISKEEGDNEPEIDFE